jgi:hypothetical protein
MPRKYNSPLFDQTIKYDIESCVKETRFTNSKAQSKGVVGTPYEENLTLGGPIKLHHAIVTRHKYSATVSQPHAIITILHFPTNKVSREGWSDSNNVTFNSGGTHLKFELDTS